MKEYFGFDAFRPLQEDVIQSVLAGNDTLALMPTGGGKSLCYQVPALAKEGLCLVISPLIALMKDQVQNLRKKNITAYSIYSGMSRREVIQTLKTVSHSNCKFLYVSPERLETSLFKEYLPGLHINLVAVDEAHCISQWGYDFRPSYIKIAALREELPGIPVLALTASAIPDVQADICEKLQPAQIKNEWKVFRQSFERPNLSYSVFRVDSKINKIIEVLTKVAGTAIIYCKSRRRTKEISELLQLKGIASNHYHAGLSQEERNRRQEEWVNNKTRVIVCTNAFGMGIDKPDVRIVIHADITDCLENYYQEAGRAGRDSKTAYAVLLQQEKDITELEALTALRFPSLEDIRKVFQSLMHYLQIPAEESAGKYYDFDIADFMRKFKLKSALVVNTLKALEQDGWLAFNEQVFLPSMARFTTTKDYLHEFEKMNPALEPLIKSLLRAYGGIFDQSVLVSEIVLAGLMSKNVELVKAGLNELDRHSIIEYRPAKDSPQILLLRNRPRTEDLSIDIKTYHQRREKFRGRTQEMLRYIKEKAACRSRFIAAYFGDQHVPDCGICDNCLQKKSQALSREEFENIHRLIITTVNSGPLHTQDLLLKMGHIKKEKAWKVIEFLQAENKVKVDQKGWVTLT